MKHLITVLTCFLIGVLKINAQYNNVGAKWYFGESDLNGLGVEKYYTYTNIKDSLINNETYSVISFIDNKGVNSKHIFYYLRAADNKIYFNQNGIKKILFDLNTKVNDTLEIDILRKDTTYLTKVNIVSIMWLKDNSVTNDSIRLYNFKSISRPFYNGYFTERLIKTKQTGNYELLNLVDWTMAPEGGNYLRCYSDSAYSYKSKLSPYICDYVSSTKDIVKTIEVNIYPNPATSNLYFDLNKPQKQLEININDSRGNLVYHALENNSQGTQVDISNWYSGLYFIDLKLDNFTKHKKFIKQ